MKHLPRTIGLAPSELPLEEFLPKLITERRRVTEELQSHATQWSKPKAKAKGKGKKKQPNLISQAMKTLGMTEEELRQAIVNLAKEEAKKKEEREEVSG